MASLHTAVAHRARATTRAFTRTERYAARNLHRSIFTQCPSSSLTLSSATTIPTALSHHSVPHSQTPLLSVLPTPPPRAQLPWGRIATASSARRHEGRTGASPSTTTTSTTPGTLTDPIQHGLRFVQPYLYPGVYAKDCVAAHFSPVIPSRHIDEAAEAVQRDAHVKRDGTSSSLFDRSDKRCRLCGVATVDAVLAVHAQNFMHQARLGIVERGVALVNWHLQLTMRQLKGYRGSRGRGVISRSARSGDALTASRISSSASDSQPATESAWGVTHVFPPGTMGLPSLEAIQARPDILAEVDWSLVLSHYWWSTLDVHTRPGGPPTSDFCRIPSLSSPSAQRRRWRVSYLLRFLISRGVLRDSLCLTPEHGLLPPSGPFGRTARFERCEMIGDNVLKHMLHDRLLRLFPTREGGLNARLALIQQMIDSNPGLLAIYDYLGLDHIIGARLPNTKAKADVIESLFGELQTYLWATETFRGVERFSSQVGRERIQLRSVVEHTMEELAHVVVMWRLQEAVTNAREFTSAHTVEPWLRREASRLSTLGCHVHRKGKGSGSTSDLGHMANDEENRRRYDPLPLLTHVRHEPPLFFRDGREMFYHSKYIAATRAGPQQEILRYVSPKPILRSAGGSDKRAALHPLERHYAADALRVRPSQRTACQRREQQQGTLKGEVTNPGHAAATVAAAMDTPHVEGRGGGGNNVSGGNAENATPPALSFVARSSPYWRAEEEEALERDAAARAAASAAAWLPQDELPALLWPALHALAETASVITENQEARKQLQVQPQQEGHRGTSGARTYPDFTAKPQPPLYTARHGDALARQIFKLGLVDGVGGAPQTDRVIRRFA